MQQMPEMSQVEKKEKKKAEDRAKKITRKAFYCIEARGRRRRSLLCVEERRRRRKKVE